jgi:hypothetical protein
MTHQTLITNMRKLFFILSIIATVAVQGRSMTDIWNAMPDSIIPYLDKNHRLEMTEFIKMGLSGDVDNQLGGKSDMDTLTADYIHVVLNEAAEMHLRRLPMPEGDSILCMVRSWKGPAEESQIYFFSQDWQPLDIANPLDRKSLDSTAAQLLVKPDTMTSERFAQLKQLLQPRLVAARLFADSDELELGLSMPFAFTDEKKDLQAITPKKRWRWTGGQFAPLN